MLWHKGPCKFIHVLIYSSDGLIKLSFVFEMRKQKRQVVASGCGEGEEQKLLKAVSKVLKVLFIITLKAFYYGKTTQHSKVGRA